MTQCLTAVPKRRVPLLPDLTHRSGVVVSLLFSFKLNKHRSIGMAVVDNTKPASKNAYFDQDDYKHQNLNSFIMLTPVPSKGVPVLDAKRRIELRALGLISNSSFVGTTFLPLLNRG